MRTVFLSIALAACTAAAADPVSVPGRLDHARDLLDTGRPDSTAVLIYDLLADIADPAERVRALSYLATATERLGRTDEAFDYLAEAVSIEAEGAIAEDVRFRYARLLLETGNPDRCFEMTRAFRERYPNSALMPDVLYLAGEASLRMGDFTRAFNLFNEVTTTWPGAGTAPAADMKAGVCLFHLDLPAGAIERLERYLAGQPGALGGDALLYLGKSYERRNQPENAAEAYRRLVLQYPGHPDLLSIYLWLGEYFFGAGMYIEAENAFENYLYNADPDNAAYDIALLYRERIMYRIGRYVTEADIARNFIAAYPRSRLTPGLTLDLARLYRSSGQVDAALEEYTRLMHMRGTGLADSALVLAAGMLDEAGERERAIAFLVDIVREEDRPRLAQTAALMLGDMNTRWERYDEAISWYEHAAGVNAERALSLRAYRGIAAVYKAMNRWFEATRTLERVVRDFRGQPGLIEAWCDLADLSILQAQLTDAVQAVEAAVKLADEPRKTDLVLMLAELYEEVDEQRALILYRQVYLDLGPTEQQRGTALLKYGDLSLRRGNRNAALNAYTRAATELADTVFVDRARNRLSTLESDTPPPPASTIED